MNTIKKQYITNITWSLLEAFFFYALLFFHQYMLFTRTDSSFYGLVGSVFSAIYLAVKLCDLGFNKILTACFLDYSQNRYAARSFFINQSLPSFTLYSIITLVILIAPFIVPQFFPSSITYALLFLVVGIIGVESSKLIIKRILHLSHNFRRVTLGELFFLIGYQACIWLYYVLNKTLTLSFVLGSFCVLSLIETIILALYAYGWYRSLPLQSQNSLVPSASVLVKNRFFSSLHTWGKQIFSANMLVPLFAYFFSLESAAVLKFASYIIHSITGFIEKMIDPSSAVLFAHTRNESTERKQEFFSFASHILYTMLACLLIFVGINHPKLLSLSGISSTMTLYVLIYFFIHYLENVFLITDKFFIAHNASEFLLITTLGNSLVAAGLFMYACTPTTALLSLVAIRLVSLIVVLYVISSRWGIQHSMRVKQSYLVGSLIASTLFFIFF